MSRLRPARDESLRTTRATFLTPLAEACATVMTMLRTVRADSLRTVLADPLSCARLLLVRRFLRVWRLPTLMLLTIASPWPAVRSWPEVP